MTKNLEIVLVNQIDMLHYQYTPGEKITLVFLHGYCEDLSMWTAFVDAFQAHSILLVDLPGFGASPTYEGLTIDKMALQVGDVLNHLAIEEAIIIGHSMGGYVAVSLSRLLGNKLKGLCMMHSHPFEDLPATKEKRSKANTFILEHGVSKFLRTLVPTFFAPSLQEEYKSVTDGLIKSASKLSSEAIINGMEAMRTRPDMQTWVEDLTCPYHCILGTEDIPTPFDFCIPQITLAPITKVTILPGVGHMGMFSATEKVRSELRDFIHFCTKIPS